MFVALAIVCDEFFVPALEVISARWELSNDIAGEELQILHLFPPIAAARSQKLKPTTPELAPPKSPARFLQALRSWQQVAQPQSCSPPSQEPLRRVPWVLAL